MVWSRKRQRGRQCGRLKKATAMRGCLKKATAMRANAIFLSLNCGAKPQNYGLIIVYFSLLCNPGARSLNRVAFHIESEKCAVLSPPLKFSGIEIIACAETVSS